MDFSKLKFDVIKQMYNQKKYKFYTDAYDLNIFAIRAKDPVVDSFDDCIGIAYVDEKGNQCLELAPGTTDPGLYWLKTPMNESGTAILKEGFYKSLWKIGMHKDYRALVQVNPVTYYRDNNRDDKLNLIPGTECTGVIGTNLHHSNYNGVSYVVGKWSAGCIVYANIKDFNKMMTLADRQVIYNHGSCFSFALFNEVDIVISEPVNTDWVDTKSTIKYAVNANGKPVKGDKFGNAVLTKEETKLN
jgi:hypothetical protein